MFLQCYNNVQIALLFLAAEKTTVSSLSLSLSFSLFFDAGDDCAIDACDITFSVRPSALPFLNFTLFLQHFPFLSFSESLLGRFFFLAMAVLRIAFAVLALTVAYATAKVRATQRNIVFY